MITNENEVTRIQRQAILHVSHLPIPPAAQEMVYQLQTHRSITGDAYCRVGIKTQDGVKEARVEIDKLQAAIAKDDSLFVPLQGQDIGSTKSRDVYPGDIEYILTTRTKALFSRYGYDMPNKSTNIHDTAKVNGYADVRGMATIKDHAVLDGAAVADLHAVIDGNAFVTGTARVYGHVGGDTVITAGDFPVDADIRNNQDFVVINTDPYYRITESPLPEAVITIYRNWDNQPCITFGSEKSYSLDEFVNLFNGRIGDSEDAAHGMLMATVRSAYDRVSESCGRQKDLQDEKDRKTSLSDIKSIAAQKKAEHEQANAECNSNRRSR